MLPQPTLHCAEVTRVAVVCQASTLQCQVVVIMLAAKEDTPLWKSVLQLLGS